MGRYKKKNLLLKYDIVKLGEATSAVANGMSIRAASKFYGVRKSTLWDRTSGRILPGAAIGRPPALTHQLESQIVKQAQDAASMGFGINRTQLMVKTGRVVRKMRLETPFRNGQPGKQWFEGLKRRHPDLSIRTPEKTTHARLRMMNKERVRRYFADLEELLAKTTLTHKPMHIWNMDETKFSLEHNPTKVCARKGERNIPGRVGMSRESLTCSICINAAGVAMPPMLIVRGKTPRCLLSWRSEDAPSGTLWTYQENGYMEDVLGEEWFRSVF